MTKRTPMPASTASASMPDPLDNREQQLLAIARRLFAHQGYDRTALRDIAEAAGITKAALYYYFPNKDALFVRIVLESLQMLVDDVSAAVARETAPTARIRAFMAASAACIDYGRDRWIAGSNAFWQGAKEGQRLAALHLRDDYEGLLRKCIVEGIASGELRAADPAMVGRFLLSALNHMTRWHKPEGKLTAQQVMLQFVDMALYGLVIDPPTTAQSTSGLRLVASAARSAAPPSTTRRKPTVRPRKP
jgi:TetR/AcrR family transcriptional regulator, cholesterol catabolism regulator